MPKPKLFSSQTLSTGFPILSTFFGGFFSSVSLLNFSRISFAPSPPSVPLGLPMRGNEWAYPFTAEAEKEFQRVQRASQQALKALPDHRALLDQVYKHGFRPKSAQAGSTIAAREDAVPTSEMMHR